MRRRPAWRDAGNSTQAVGNFALKGVGDIKLWDADYDQHGPRKPEVLSLEQVRRNHRLKILGRALVTECWPPA